MKLRLHISEHIKKQELKFLPLFLIFQLMVKWQKIDIAFNLETIPNPLTLTYQDKANNQNTETLWDQNLKYIKIRLRQSELHLHYWPWHIFTISIPIFS